MLFYFRKVCYLMKPNDRVEIINFNGKEIKEFVTHEGCTIKLHEKGYIIGFEDGEYSVYVKLDSGKQLMFKESELKVLDTIDFHNMVKLQSNIKTDIQFLLLKWMAYIDDTSTYNSPWENKQFSDMCKKYGFTKENIYDGFEYMFC